MTSATFNICGRKTVIALAPDILDLSENTSMAGTELSTLKICRGARTYFFDINKSSNGGLYLKISESRKTGLRFEHHRLMVFDEDIEEFSEMFRKMLLQYRVLKAGGKPATKSVAAQDERKTTKSAHDRWTPAEDDRLELLFCEGHKPKELSKRLGRNVGVIYWRIKKLELREKYGM